MISGLKLMCQESFVLTENEFDVDQMPENISHDQAPPLSDPGGN